MNRQQRRAAAAQARATRIRHEAVTDALAYLAIRNDPSITGATLILPGGETLYLDAATARATAKPGGVH